MQPLTHSIGAVELCVYLLVILTVPGWGDAPLSVFVSIPPQAEFVEQVGGARVSVEVLLPPGANPATYNPTPKQIIQLSQAQLYFRVGVPFENAFLPSVEASLKNLRVVDTREGVPLRRMEADDEPDKEGAGHKREGGADPHIWLSPLLVKQQAATIRGALIETDPAGRETYEKNCANFAAELDALHQRLTRVLAPLKDREIFVYHPAYGYFADAYGLKQVAVEMGGKEPSPRRVAELIRKAKARGVRVIFVQPQFSRKSAEALAQAIGGTAIALDPLAKDYLKNLEEMAQAIKKSELKMQDESE